ncbi:MAG: polyprenyl synthetase family protein [Candidatus Latescibacter sp.]|nr:polyprenyl synthetase family protein [Candidatus Latescibacter sp.]
MTRMKDEKKLKEDRIKTLDFGLWALDCSSPLEYLALHKSRVDEYLDRYLLPETVEPVSIHQAIRYSVFSGGKRFRAGLCIAACETFGGEREKVLPVASGIELIHTYSLIHDDLPCMDNDDLRRGKPTLHRVFGENIAVLAGDALNALAFDLVARAEDPRLIRILAHAIGTEGMIGGQVADVESSGKENITPQDVKFIHSHKTAALIRASLEMGAVTGGASAKHLETVGEFGSQIGLAFQIVDDILDIESSDEVLGKDVGSDENKDKATYPKVYGLSRSKDIACGLVIDAKNLLCGIDRDTSILQSLAEFVISRVN